MSDDVRNHVCEYDAHAMYLAAAKRRTRRPIGTRTRPPAHTTLAERRAQLYADRHDEIARYYWAGYAAEIRNDTMTDIADDVRREFGV